MNNEQAKILVKGQTIIVKEKSWIVTDISIDENDVSICAENDGSFDVFSPHQISSSE